MRFLIKKRTITTIIFTIALFHLSFVSISSIRSYESIQLICIATLLFYFFVQYKKIIIINTKTSNIVFVLLAMSIMLSSLLNREYGSSLQNILINWFRIVCPYFLFRLFAYDSRLNTAIKALYVCSLLYCLIIDLPIIASSALPTISTTYLIGNKFNVAYLHLFLIVFYLSVFSDSIYGNHTINFKKILFIVQVIFSTMITLKVDCMTGVIAIIILCFLVVFKCKIETLLSNPGTVLITMVISGTLLLLYSEILNLSAVNYFITDILGRDADLTGRLRIFSYISDVISQNPLFGFGRENNHQATMLYASAANLQNGLYDHIVSYGIVGTILMMILVIKALRKASNNFSYPFIVLLYIWILLSMVEITYNVSFYITISIIYACKDLIEVNNEKSTD